MIESKLLLGKYEIRQVLGKGGGSIVYLARHTKLKTDRAIKCISKTRSMPTSIFSEANLTDSLRHPGIPVIYDMEEDDQTIYIVEEYIQGESLEQILLQQESISQQYMVQIALQLCDILQFLHNHKPDPILYQDLKPSHIIVCGNQVKLIDFGIASYITNLGTNFQKYGTKGFAAPEQYNGGRLQVQTDIYALGAVLACYERRNSHSCSRSFRHIVAKCMRNNPAKRYQNVEELQYALQQTLNYGRNLSEHLLHHVIVVAASPGAGATHIAIACNSYLNRQKQPSLYLDASGGEVTDRIAMQSAAKIQQDGCVAYQHFVGKSVTEAAGEAYQGTMICDYGTKLNEALLEDGELTILVVDLSVWRQEAAVKAYQQLKQLSNLMILCNHGDRQQVKWFAALTGRKIYYVPYEKNPFRESKKTEALFTQMLERKECV
ncbi:MAG: serine/threonine protein kinase [Roseburia sp.]